MAENHIELTQCGIRMRFQYLRDDLKPFVKMRNVLVSFTRQQAERLGEKLLACSHVD